MFRCNGSVIRGSEKKCLRMNDVVQREINNLTSFAIGKGQTMGPVLLIFTASTISRVSWKTKQRFSAMAVLSEEMRKNIQG